MNVNVVIKVKVNKSFHSPLHFNVSSFLEITRVPGTVPLPVPHVCLIVVEQILVACVHVCHVHIHVYRSTVRSVQIFFKKYTNRYTTHFHFHHLIHS